MVTPKEKARIDRLTAAITSAVDTARCVATARGVNNLPGYLDVFIGTIHVGRAALISETGGYRLLHSVQIDGQLVPGSTVFPSYTALLQLDAGA